MTRLGIIVCLFFSLLIGLDGFGYQRELKSVRLEGFCKEYKDVPIIYHFEGLKMNGTTLLFNNTIEVKKEVKGDLKLMLNLQKCKFPESPDTCQEFNQFKGLNYCELLESDSDLWNPFFSGIKPQWRCPIKKGIYRGYNSPLDFKAFAVIPGSYWRVKTTIIEEKSKQIIFCLRAYAQIIAKKA